MAKIPKYAQVRSFPVMSLERFVDGDTFIALIDVGFDLHMKVRARVVDINSPELNTLAGKAAKQAAENWAFAAFDTYGLMFFCEGKDKYGRWLGDLQLPTNVSTEDFILNNYALSQYMLENNFAVVYNM